MIGHESLVPRPQLPGAQDPARRDPFSRSKCGRSFSPVVSTAQPIIEQIFALHALELLPGSRGQIEISLLLAPRFDERIQVTFWNAPGSSRSDAALERMGEKSFFCPDADAGLRHLQDLCDLSRAQCFGGFEGHFELNFGHVKSIAQLF